MADLAFVDELFERRAVSAKGTFGSGQRTWKRSMWSTPSAPRLSPAPVESSRRSNREQGRRRSSAGPLRRDDDLVPAMVEVSRSAFPSTRSEAPKP